MIELNRVKMNPNLFKEKSNRDSNNNIKIKGNDFLKFTIETIV